jgi:ribosomal protein L11 methyltransferase
VENWIEVSVRVPESRVDAIAAVLDWYGKGGAVVEVASRSKARGVARGAVWTVRTYLKGNGPGARRKKAIFSALAGLRWEKGLSAPKIRKIRDADWAEQWKKGYRTHRVGRRMVVVPSWIVYKRKKKDLVIRLDPGMAFGTGLHATTRLCLQALERLIRPGMVVLDIGTGSGILAIAAAGLGASQVVAIDNDPAAVSVARDNVRANGADPRVRVICGTLHSFRNRVPDADVMVSNILSGTILRMAPDLFSKLRVGGTLVVSGILRGETPAVAERLSAAGFSVRGRKREGEWACVIAHRAEE